MMKSRTTSRTRARHGVARSARAFTLIELLVVLGVIAVFFAMAAPQINGLLGSNRLTSMGELVYNKFSQAQQMAITESRDIQVRLFTYRDPYTPGSNDHFRGFQFAGWNDLGEMVEETDVVSLDSGIIISKNEELSSLVNNLPISEDTAIVPKVDEAVPFISFVYHPDGSTSLPDLSASGSGSGGSGGGISGDEVDNNWYLTLVDEIDEDRGIEVPPRNYYCIQIDPASGRLTAYRP